MFITYRFSVVENNTQVTRQYENLSLSGCQILCQKSAKPSSNIKTVLVTFSEPKYLKRLLQNYFFYKNPRILGNFFRKVFILFDLGVFRWLANSKVPFHTGWDCVRLRVVSIFP